LGIEEVRWGQGGRFDRRWMAMQQCGEVASPRPRAGPEGAACWEEEKDGEEEGVTGRRRGMSVL
jgi:hypothetical protein